MQWGMKDAIEIEVVAAGALAVVVGGAGTTIQAPLSGSVHQNIQAPLNRVTVNAPKGPVTMNWGARTIWGDFSWSFQVGK